MHNAITKLAAQAIRYSAVKTLPTVMMDGKISVLAHQCGLLSGGSERVFNRGDVPMSVSKMDGGYVLRPISPAGFRSEVEHVADLKVLKGGKDKQVAVTANCSESTAKAVIKSRDYLDELPVINIITQCPVLVKGRSGKLQQVSGYNRKHAILAEGQRIPIVDLNTAVGMLDGLLDDFKFTTAGDRSRALAHMLTPAFVMGGLLKSRVPVDLGEANEPQSGKGYRIRLKAAIYNSTVTTVTKKSGGGVGSLEESFSGALIQGKIFISIDNLRGQLNSQDIESFLTEDVFSARMPYRGPVIVDPRRYLISATSNMAELTPDMSNRSCIVGILKQPAEYKYKQYPEGDLMAHVKEKWPEYLGAVFSVVMAYYDQGCPRTDEHRHSFREWVQTMDWIVQNIFDRVPLLDGHEEVQARTVNPNLTWLRAVAIQLHANGKVNEWLRTYQILDELVGSDIEIPGMTENDTGGDEANTAVLQAMGRKLKACFKGEDRLVLDNLCISRRESADDGNYRNVNEYMVVEEGNNFPPIVRL